MDQHFVLNAVILWKVQIFKAHPESLHDATVNIEILEECDEVTIDGFTISSSGGSDYESVLYRVKGDYYGTCYTNFRENNHQSSRIKVN